MAPLKNAYRRTCVSIAPFQVNNLLRSCSAYLGDLRLHDRWRQRWLADHVGIMSDRLWAADQKPLDAVTFRIGQKSKLFFGLHTFGDDRQPKPLAEPDHRTHNRGRLRA